jgi:tetratricopeptide (TPR) repeat protein
MVAKISRVELMLKEASTLMDNAKAGQGTYTAAVVKLNDAASIIPSYSKIFLKRAAAYQQLQQKLRWEGSDPEGQTRYLQWALDDITKYLKAVPSDFDGLNQYMMIRADLDSYSSSAYGPGVLPGQPLSPQVEKMATLLIQSGNLDNEQLGLAYLRRAGARTRYNERDEGVLADLAAAIRQDPKEPAGYRMRSEFLHSADPAQSAADLAKAKQLETAKAAESANKLAWDLATSRKLEDRDGKKAFEWAKQACDLTGYRNWEYLGTLAAAYAECRDFDNAVKYATKSLEFAPPARKDECQSRLGKYRAKEPFRR